MRSKPLKFYAMGVAAAFFGNALAADCSISDLERTMTMTLDQFDQSHHEGWRALQDRECFSDAAVLIDEYSVANGGKPQLALHAAQMYLMAGNYGEARKRIVAAYRSDLDESSDFRFNDYLTAYLAFIDNDRDAMERARARVASRSDDFRNRMNLKVVDEILRHLGEPYASIFPPQSS